MKKLFTVLFVMSIVLTIGCWFITTCPVWINMLGGHASYDLTAGVGMVLTGMTAIPVMGGWFAAWKLFVASSDK